MVAKLGVFAMKKEEIEAKLAKLNELYKKLRALRTSKGEVFNEEAENLLSQAQLIEEALKNYMYQFGMSIYRNKRGKRFFKKFIHDEDEVRGFDELDVECFDFRPAEPSFLQRLFEYTPEDHLVLTTSVEDAFYHLYEKDEMMADIFDELVNEEAGRCSKIIGDLEIDNNIEKTFEIVNEINTPELEVKSDEATLDIGDIEKEIEQDVKTQEQEQQIKVTRKAKTPKKMQEAFECGTSGVKKSKPRKTAKKSAEVAYAEGRKDQQNQR